MTKMNKDEVLNILYAAIDEHAKNRLSGLLSDQYIYVLTKQLEYYGDIKDYIKENLK